MEQEIHFCTAHDGVRIAYAVVGERSNLPLVRVATWLTHLEFDWRSPIWRHWLEGLANDFFLVRYDPRGCGLSDWQANDISFESWVRDLEAVVDAVGLDRFALLGVSQGGAVGIEYTLRHPGRVSQLILYGAYAKGWAKRAKSETEEREALVTLTKQGWGRDNPAYRQIFTTLFVPDATIGQMRWFNDLQRKSMSAENAMKFQIEAGKLDVVDKLSRVSVPTLVLHARNDALVPYEAGRLLAASIPNARFVTLEGRNHILLETESAWPRFLHEVHNFVGISPVEALPPKNKGSDSETSSRKAGAGNSRRLSAIMFLDIVSFTAMVQKNETFALKLLEELGLLIRPVFRKYNGRQVKSMGDGFLAEFGSATEASLCAVDIQKTLYDRAKSLPQSEILVRIGIHLGDVEHKGKDIYGDSVNIASRIEPLAESGGICISEQVFFQIQNKTDFQIAKLGRQALKNVRFPMNVYKIILPWEKEIAPDKLSRTKSSIV